MQGKNLNNNNFSQCPKKTTEICELCYLSVRDCYFRLYFLTCSDLENYHKLERDTKNAEGRKKK